MLLVPVRADRSPLHGLGIFSVTNIKAGTPIWRFQPGFDREFTEEQFAALPGPAQEHVRHYGFRALDKACWVLNGDLGIFMNHSAHPNTGAPGSNGMAEWTFALRDVNPGEELTCDYHAFDSSERTGLGSD